MHRADISPPNLVERLVGIEFAVPNCSPAAICAMLREAQNIAVAIEQRLIVTMDENRRLIQDREECRSVSDDRLARLKVLETESLSVLTRRSPRSVRELFRELLSHPFRLSTR